MDRKNFDGLCAYVGALWGRELSQLQCAGGWKLLHDLPNEAVENAVTLIAERGDERMPPWPVVLKTARSIADGMRDELPALPQGDSLTDSEHRGAMIMLRAGQTDEQRRRADRMTRETEQLPMGVRLRLATLLLLPPFNKLESKAWDKIFAKQLDDETAKTLVSA